MGKSNWHWHRFTRRSIVCTHRRRSRTFFDEEAKQPKEELRAKLLYYALFFSSAAKVARADGGISSKEIECVESLIKKFSLNQRLENFAKDIFRKSKESKQPITVDFKACGKLIQFNPTLAHSFLGGLFEIAKSNGPPISHSQLKCLLLGEAILRIQPGTVKSWFRSGQFHSPESGKNVSELDDSYHILGVDKSVDFDLVKKSFREKIRLVHPDQLTGKKLPQELIIFAQEQAVRLNLAFEKIKRARGIK